MRIRVTTKSGHDFYMNVTGALNFEEFARVLSESKVVWIYDSRCLVNVSEIEGIELAE